jgi:hypothetical protein
MVRETIKKRQEVYNYEIRSLQTKLKESTKL